MYSYEENELYGFNILDPDSDIIATVKSVEEAEVLISHLNR